MSAAGLRRISPFESKISSERNNFNFSTAVKKLHLKRDCRQMCLDLGFFGENKRETATKLGAEVPSHSVERILAIESFKQKPSLTFPCWSEGQFFWDCFSWNLNVFAHFHFPVREKSQYVCLNRTESNNWWMNWFFFFWHFCVEWPAIKWIELIVTLDLCLVETF